MKAQAGRLWVLAVLVAASLSTSCGGGGGSSLKIAVMGENILHGITHEDPAAQPYDSFPQRLPLIISPLMKAKPEIITLQEVLVQGPSDYPNVRQALLGALGDGYTTVFGDITGDAINEGTLGQLTVTRLPVLSSENHYLGNGRSVHRATVQTKLGQLDIYNVHLGGTDPQNAQAAVDEINNVLDFINKTRTGGPVLLEGDFNAHPEDPSIQAVLKAGFVDAMVKVGDATCAKVADVGCTSGTFPLVDNPKNLTSERIDYIFTLSGSGTLLDAEQASVFNNVPANLGGGHYLWASDHIGVQAVLVMHTLSK
jgi:endonuclease/exonuclease/phosphatase family metal-dependent hydrolase